MVCYVSSFTRCFVIKIYSLFAKHSNHRRGRTMRFRSGFTRSDFDRQLIYPVNALSPTSPTISTTPQSRPIVICSYLWEVVLTRKFLIEYME